MGLDVDPIHSVHFSNHTGYPTFRGTRMDGDQFIELVDGLFSNKLFNYSHILTGYIGNVSLLEAIAQLLTRIQQVDSIQSPIYVCDPVLGDNGKLYVSEELGR